MLERSERRNKARTTMQVKDKSRNIEKPMQVKVWKQVNI